MNRLMLIIILQILLGQVLSNTFNKRHECFCKVNNPYKYTLGVECESFNLMDLIKFKSIIKCYSDQTISKFNFTNRVVSLQLLDMRFNGSLETTYFSNLEGLDELYITQTKLILTNESFEGTPHLTKLYLRQNYIEDIPADVFKPLTLLKILDLGDNKITKINSDLFYGIPLESLKLDTNYLKSLDLNSQSLKVLDLTNNRITSLTVGHLNQLHTISLNQNILVTMPDLTFRNTSLMSIEFSYGNFTTIPRRFLTNLNRLNNVNLTSLNIEEVPDDMIWYSGNIRTLSLASNRLTELPEMFFRDATELKLLDLSKNQIKKIKHKLLLPLKNLETIDLSNNLIIRFENCGLQDTRLLRFLNLQNNKMTHFNTEQILSFIQLRKLDLSNNKISEWAFYDYTFPLFVKAIENQIEFIDLSNNFINYFDPILRNLDKLTYIDLSNNNFTVLMIQDILYLSEYVNVNLINNPLEVIDMSNVNISGKSKFWNKINMSSDKLICDCRNYDLARFLHYNQMLKNEKKIDLQ